MLQRFVALATFSVHFETPSRLLKTENSSSCTKEDATCQVLDSLQFSFHRRVKTDCRNILSRFYEGDIVRALLHIQISVRMFVRVILGVNISIETGRGETGVIM